MGRFGDFARPDSITDSTVQHHLSWRLITH